MLPTQLFNGKVYKLYPGERYFSRGPKRLHRVVWEFYNSPIPKGYHVHHKDLNPHNNDIGNLQLKLESKYLKAHLAKRKEALRVHAANIRPLAKEWHGSAEGRAWHSQHGVKVMATRKPRQLNCAHCHAPFETLSLDPNARFCHNNCKMKARRRRMKGLPEDAGR